MLLNDADEETRIFFLEVCNGWSVETRIVDTATIVTVPSFSLWICVSVSKIPFL